MKNQEVPVRLAECRRIFGRGRTWMSAIKRELGVKGNSVMISAVNKFVRENPDWTEAEVYRRKPKAWKVVIARTSGSGQIIVRSPSVVKSGTKTVRAGRVEIEVDGEVVDVK